MADKIEYSRLIMKQSTITGVTPSSTTASQLSEFTNTDIFVGELFLNTEDDRAWWRSKNGIIEFGDASNDILEFTDDTVRIKEIYEGEPIEFADNSVCSGTNSVIIGGSTNNILGGKSNGIIASDKSSQDQYFENSVIVGGSQNTMSREGLTQESEFNAIVGGNNNRIVGTGSDSNAYIDNSIILGGKQNKIQSSTFSSLTTSSDNNSILGGDGNEIIGSINSSIIGGEDSTIRESVNCISIGNRLPFDNVVSSTSSVTMGDSNITDSDKCFSVGDSDIDNSISSISMGQGNNVNDSFSSASIGGISNTITDSNFSATIGGFANNITSHDTSVIVGGTFITAQNQNTVYVPDFVITKSHSIPSSSASTEGSLGSITWDDNYMYVKVSTGWKRVGLSTF